VTISFSCLNGLVFGSRILQPAFTRLSSREDRETPSILHVRVHVQPCSSSRSVNIHMLLKLNADDSETASPLWRNVVPMLNICLPSPMPSPWPAITANRTSVMSQFLPGECPLKSHFIDVPRSPKPSAQWVSVAIVGV
jgi:hypothetical protein